MIGIEEKMKKYCNRRICGVRNRLIGEGVSVVDVLETFFIFKLHL